MLLWNKTPINLICEINLSAPVAMMVTKESGVLVCHEGFY